MVAWIKVIAGVSVSLCLLAGCGPVGTMEQTDQTSSQKESLELVQLQKPNEGQDMAVLHTSLGNISILLYGQYAPNTVNQFKKLVQDGFYNGKNIFPISGDEHTFLSGADGQDGSSGTVATENGKPVEPEVTPNVWHFSGAVSAYGKETGIFNKRYVSDSRFFIVGNQSAQTELIEQMEEGGFPREVISAYKKLGGRPQYTGFYTVFGQVIDGMDVVEELITKVQSGAGEDLMINSAELTTYSEEMFASVELKAAS